MTTHHLAQINIAHARFKLEDSRMRGFVDALDTINGLAESHPGFVWRLKNETDPSTYVHANTNPQILINISVWTGPETLKDFVYKGAHAAMVGQRKQWFEPMKGPTQALWWIEVGQYPSVEEGMQRLALLEENGPTPAAFTFRKRFLSTARADTR